MVPWILRVAKVPWVFRHRLCQSCKAINTDISDIIPESDRTIHQTKYQKASIAAHQTALITSQSEEKHMQKNHYLRAFFWNSPAWWQ